MNAATVNTGGDEAPAANETPGTQRRNHSIGIFILLLLLLNCRAANNRAREGEWKRSSGGGGGGGGEEQDGMD